MPSEPQREIDLDIIEKVKAHALNVGMSAWAWNELHGRMFVLFWFLSENPHDRKSVAYEKMHAIWHSVQSDSTQRQMVLAAAEPELRNQPKLFAAIKWAVDQTGELAKYRNAAIHIQTAFDGETSGPRADAFSAPTAHAARFNSLDHRKFWDDFTGDLVALSHYVGGLASAVYPVRLAEPWCDIPASRILGATVRTDRLLESLKAPTQALPMPP